MRLGHPLFHPEQFRTHLCSQYHFSMYPGIGLAIGCPPVTESTVIHDVFGNGGLGTCVDCDFMCTGARQNGPEKSSAQGTHKLSPTWPEARLEKILMKHVPFPIAPDFRPKTCPKITVHAIVRFFASLFSSFTAISHFTVRPGRGKPILASPRDDRRAPIFDVRDRFCDHLLSRKCVDWVRFAQGCREM